MIQIEGAGKAFDGKWVFRDLSLEVKEGESVVIVGPSGSGKSLLLKIVAGLVGADAGKITIDTENIGMLFQKNALFDSMTVAENLLFPMRERIGLTGELAQMRASRFLAEVGLSGCEKLLPSELSGGMQKRLGIARALAVRPEVILYDEPTAGLDPITSRTIADLIQRLRREDRSTLITVTNDMQRAYQIGDRILLLAQGKLIDGGSPSEVKTTVDPALKQFIYGLSLGPLTSASPDSSTLGGPQ